MPETRLGSRSAVLAHHASDDEPTEDEWGEIKRLALEQVVSSMLDTPEHHLAYIRKQSEAKGR